MECKTITSLQEIFKNGYGNLMSSAITQPEDIAQANDSEGIKQARALFEGSNEKVAAIYAKGRHRQWAKTVRELALGGKELYFEAVGDSERLSKIVVVLKVAADDEAVESDGIDVSAYGFSVPGSSGLLTELEGLTSQVKAMEAKVGVYLSQVSLLGDDDVGDAAHGGGASAGGVPAAGFHYGVPTEEFPGGIDLVPTTGTKYWRPEGYYDSDHNPGHGWTWYPGSSYPLVVVPDWTPPSPGGAPPSPDYEPEEVE
ncbi:hypothetical protein CYMTET_54273 [Cymbomonas tetramitiformis]|uniref:Uncharacterized protein n=1 Tax=Cymbomonas tetramitiformis TaxID=36881 RepID=A0AAE0BGN0_9CHLO|nr:hypothetical protein CYMTET_54273 [Cymbomonas tetramitiformis]